MQRILTDEKRVAEYEHFKLQAQLENPNSHMSEKSSMYFQKTIGFYVCFTKTQL